VARTTDLGSAARAFATLLQNLLNQTICDGVRVSAVVVPADRQRVIVGTNIEDLIATRVPVNITRKKPQVWLEVAYRCFLDPETGYLTVMSSYCAIYGPDDKCLCHYDYERNKPDYPAAHLQIHGDSPALGALPGPRKSIDLAKLHFPVGGRRYRPCLEDIIEFLIVEGFAQGREGWEAILEAERERFLQIQLKAAIRHKPELARSVLAEIETA
jgi:hypothetical protein